MPFVEFRENRIVSGIPEGIAVAGVWGWLLVGIASIALALAFIPERKMRGTLVLCAGVSLFAVLPWALGAAAVSLRTDAASISRVSLASGAWLVLVGGGIVWYAGTRGRSGTGARVVGAFAAAGSWILAVWIGDAAQLSLALEYAVRADSFWQRVREHLVLSGLGLGFGLLIGVPLGVLASRNRTVREATLTVVGIVQTVPSLALLGLLVFPLVALGLPGIGTVPAAIALTLYALLPIVRNTYVGLAGVDPGALDAGRGMGMSRRQLLLRVEAPLALPLVLEGIRAAAVLVIGIAAVTAFVGAGGLGILVFEGWGQQADDLTLLGALPMVALAVLADAAVRVLASVAVSPGIREGSEGAAA